MSVKETHADQLLGEQNHTWRDEREGREIARDTFNPLRGSPLRQRLRPGSSEVASYLGALGGPRPYMIRLRTIEELERELLEQLREAYRETPREQWGRVAERWDFFEINDLIDRHNRYFPIESGLPMDPRTGDFATLGGRPYRRRPLDAAWILERFPVAAAA
jgi:hypothetical protein